MSNNPTYNPKYPDQAVIYAAKFPDSAVTYSDKYPVAPDVPVTWDQDNNTWDQEGRTWDSIGRSKTSYTEKYPA